MLDGGERPWSAGLFPYPKGDENASTHVARHARDTAALVSKHEEDLRRVVARYEAQLAAVPAHVDQDASCANPSKFLLHQKFQAERLRAETAEADLRRYQRRDRRQRTRLTSETPDHFAPEVQWIQPLTSTTPNRTKGLKMSETQIGRKMPIFAEIATQTEAETQTNPNTSEAKVATETFLASSPSPVQNGIVPFAADPSGARCSTYNFESFVRDPGSCPPALENYVKKSARRILSFKFFSAWAFVTSDSRHQRMSEADLKMVTDKFTDAQALLRADTRFLKNRVRLASYQTLSAKLLLALLTPFTAWSRAAATASHATVASNLQAELERGDAGRREAASARRAALAAARNEARMSAFARRCEDVARLGDCAGKFIACIWAWKSEVKRKKQEEALRSVRERADASVKQAVAKTRLENRSTLHRAWDETTQASRRASAFERRCEAISQRFEEPQATTLMSEILRESSALCPRPSTALGVERQLNEASREAHRRNQTARQEGSNFIVDPGSCSLTFAEMPETIGSAELLVIE